MQYPITMKMVFHEDNSIDCFLSSIQGVSPRMMNDGFNMLMRKYQERVGQERIRIERAGWEQRIADEKVVEKKAAAKDKKEDSRLARAGKGAAARHEKVLKRIENQTAA